MCIRDRFSANENFGSVAMGQTSPAATLTATFSAAETIGAPQALEMGAAGMDYAVSGGTCKAGQSYSAGSSCTVAVDGAGNLFVASLGYNAVFEIPIGCQTLSCLVQVGSGFNQPYGVALDSSDNVFVADGGNSAIKEVLAAGGYTTVNTLVSGLNDPWSVVVDANENLFVGEGGNQCQVYLVLDCNPINTGVVVRF